MHPQLTTKYPYRMGIPLTRQTVGVILTVVSYQGRQPLITPSQYSSLEGLDTDPIQIHSISVVPDPPQPGKDLTVKVKATVLQTIDVTSRFVQWLSFSDAQPGWRLR